MSRSFESFEYEETSRHGRRVPTLFRTDGRVLAWHVTMGLRVDSLIARTPRDFRAASRVILRHGERSGLLAHRVVDTHVHALVGPDREQAGRFANYVESALQQTLHLPQPFEPARFTPITQLRHLYRAVPYVLRQAERHGARLDRVHDGSSLPDTLGLRCIDGGPSARLEAVLPRFDARDLLSLLGVTELAMAPVLVEHLADAAASAFALADLRGRSAEQVVARRAAIAVAGSSIPTCRLAEVLHVSRRAVQLERHEPVPKPLQRAVELQAKLRARLDGPAPADSEPWENL